MKIQNGLSKKFLGVCFTLFILFALLAYYFPYSGDDWAWGSSIGISRLENLFRSYNGRYAGNLLVMLLTRMKPIKILLVAGSFLFLCLAANFLNQSDHVSLVIFSACLLLLIPKQIFVQSLAWTAGYANYVPPILLTILYFLLIRNIFEDEKPRYNPFMTSVVFLLGFVSNLFMENLTLYHILVSLLIIVFVMLRFRCFYAVHLAHFIGSLVGAVLMFSNSAYYNIANNTDSYRSTALSKGLRATIASHSKIIVEQFFLNNLPILAVISILCVILSILHMKQCKDFRRIYASWIAIFVNILCLGILYAKDGFGYWMIAVGSSHSTEFTLITMMLAAFMYCFAILMTVLLCIPERNYMFKSLLLLFSVPVIIAPLLVVNPIGPRCFFPPYALLILFCATMFHYIQEKYNFGLAVRKGINVPLMAVLTSLFVFHISIYGTIHSYDVKREYYVQKQVEAGCETITVCKLPYTSFVWYGDPTTEPWGERFKLFYGLDKDTEFTFLSYAEFNKWTKEFETKN